MKKLILAILGLTILGCKSPEPRFPVTHSSGSFIKESAERNIKLLEEEQRQIQVVIDGSPEMQFIASENGFWYHYNDRIDEDSITPQFGDIVNFDYDISNLQGQTIYSKEEIATQNYAMDQQELFSGLREGLKLMKAGESITFLFPSQKAYGYYGDEKRIGTNVPIMCNVKVNTITQKETN